MASKKRGSVRTSPHAGGPARSALAAATKRKSTGGWRNAKVNVGAAPIRTSPGSTDTTTPSSYYDPATSAGGGGRSTSRRGAGYLGSLSMPGVVVVKRPRAGASHFSSAQPAGGAARKVRKQKAPGK